MAKDRLSDTLAVILHADVEGSTELIHQDKQLAHERIRDSFQRFSNTIEKYHGQVLELRGDALLASFERSSDAVAAALAFQADHAYQNSRLQDDLRPVIRVGISMGEVVIADNTVTGTGVVQAQRVEQLAGPGGICITAVIHDSLSKRMPFEIVSLGEKELKGFDNAVHVYRVELASGKSVPAPIEAGNQNASPGNRRLIAAFVAVILVIVGGTAFWFKSQGPKVEAASIDRMAFPLPDKPSIAVLPFTNMSNDTEQEYFVDGLTEDLITDISKVSGLFVIARNSVFTYKGKAVKVRQVAEELGVRYVMEGSVRRVGNQVRITAQLIDATTGGHLWAERYDGSLQDIFALQDQVTRKIVSALKIKLTVEEEAQQAQHSTGNAEAHDAFLQGWAHYRLGGKADLARSIPYLEEAVRLDPGYADAHALLATVYWDALKRDWVFDLGIPHFEVEDRVNHYLEEALKTPNLLAHAQQSRIFLSLGFPDKAVREAEMAVALDPNSATAHAALANTLILTNRPQEGIDAIRKAIRLDPHHPPEYPTILGAAQFGLEQFEVAVTTFERAIKRNPDSETSLIYLASSYGHLGDLRKAEATIETANDLRATNMLGALTLERNIIAGCRPISDGFDFPRFGPKRAQDRLRLGLSKIPSLSWQTLIAGSASGASGKTFDSAMGEWSFRVQGPDCILEKPQMIFVDEIKVTYPPSFRKGRVFWYAIDDQRKWEGYWVEGTNGNCADKKDGSNYWGVVTFRFNESYTQWKGEFDICGVGRKYPWDGFRQ